MRAWLLSGGYRWRQVAMVIRPGQSGLEDRAREGQARITLRLHGEPATPADLTAEFALEVEGQVRRPLRICELTVHETQHEWELVAELGWSVEELFPEGPAERPPESEPQDDCGASASVIAGGTEGR